MLNGSLDSVSLPGLLQLLSAERRTGRLDLDQGSLWLDEGGIIHASCGDVSGEDAVFGAFVLDRNSGKIRALVSRAGIDGWRAGCKACSSDDRQQQHSDPHALKPHRRTFWIAVSMPVGSHSGGVALCYKGLARLAERMRGGSSCEDRWW